MTVLVTGASGFVGKAVVKYILDRDNSVYVKVSSRRAGENWPDRALPSAIDGIDSATDWTAALTGVTAIVHCAARVHVMADSAKDPLEEFRRVNVQGTLNFAKQAAAAGVRRFVFISSIKVNGEATTRGVPFNSDSNPSPCDPYGISKMEAEQALREVAAQTAMEVVIIRPPLVYGSDVKGNFQSMMRWLRRGIPLPLGAIHNQRSLVALDNLVDLVVTCIDHPAAANQTFLVSDGEDLSTTELLERMGHALGKPARLLPVPATLIKWGAFFVGKSDMAQRLCGSLQVDISKTCQLLGWTPPISVDEGLQKAAKGYLREKAV